MALHQFMALRQFMALHQFMDLQLFIFILNLTISYSVLLASYPVFLDDVILSEKSINKTFLLNFKILLCLLQISIIEIYSYIVYVQTY